MILSLVEPMPGNNGIAAATTNVLLRWSRLTGTVNFNSVAGIAFTLANIPGYINTLDPTLSLMPQVYAYPNATAFDAITDVSQLSASTSRVASICSLYLGACLRSRPQRYVCRRSRFSRRSVEDLYRHIQPSLYLGVLTRQMPTICQLKTPVA
jgi:hypothetical protein